jgi:hypothetical protein
LKAWILRAGVSDVGATDVGRLLGCESNHRWTPEKREGMESHDERRKKRRQASRGRRPLFFCCGIFILYFFSRLNTAIKVTQIAVTSRKLIP